ncbi:MAG TPA: hypothetical protein VH413_15590 [Verrucomicrobiae bacterium]|jgi:MYXO-CTERM domain-containing protein|nr:hypothetical protein [Verrucomicrobiae bacterium]
MNKKILAAASCWAVTGAIAFADGSFGPLPEATFNPTGANTGNPNNAVESTTYGAGEEAFTLGLAAQQRYTNPALQNNGAGTYFATTGANVQGTPPTLGSLWNVDFYINVFGPTSAGGLSGFTFKLFYDFDPAANTPKSQLGFINLNAANIATGGSATTKTLQDSENLDFNFFATPVSGVVAPPTGVTSFDPNAPGEYSFILEADDASTGAELTEVDITVDVSSVPDVSATAPLLALALGGLGMFRRRQAGR